MDRKRVLWFFIVPVLAGSFAGFLRATIENCEKNDGVVVVGVLKLQCVVPAKGE